MNNLGICVCFLTIKGEQCYSWCDIIEILTAVSSFPVKYIFVKCMNLLFKCNTFLQRTRRNILCQVQQSDLCFNSVQKQGRL